MIIALVILIIDDTETLQQLKEIPIAASDLNQLYRQYFSIQLKFFYTFAI